MARRLAASLAAVALCGPAAAGLAAAVAPATAGARVHVLKRGSRGAAVARVQRALGITADGIFGPATARAVKRFQRAHGLTVDGVVGPATLAALSGSSHRRRAHHHHSGGAATVRHLQALLGIPADGVFGPQTRAAVMRFQRAHGLVVDGVVGPATWAALGVHSSRVLHARATRRPGVVSRVVAAANRIATTPYKWGGGHGSWQDSGYDCSGSVSYALHGGGLLPWPLVSGAFESYGLPGPGRHITIYANATHVYMVVDGRRYDTSGLSARGTRWTGEMRSARGFVVRHPRGY